jgi:hypothetical protein
VSLPTTTALNSIRSSGLKAIIPLAETFFETDAAATTNKIRLRADYMARWASLEPVLSSHLDVIHSFYPYDEPYWAAYNYPTSPSMMLGMLK